MARMYNCKCGQQHPIGTECPNKYKYKRDNSTENTKKINKFYSTKEWKETREKIKERDLFCQRCKIKFGLFTYENLQIHHIEPLLVKWEKRLEPSNLITLCANCHAFIDRKYNGKLDFDWTPPIEEEYIFEFR